MTGPKLALAGRVVTMDARDRVLDRGVVYIGEGAVVDVRERQRRPPAGFEDCPVVETGGTLFPGLIELHNHLSYNALPLWAPVPKKFRHRDQWPSHEQYRRLVSGPMRVLGKTPRLLPALVRYVECKCLLAGVTTTQGITLYSNGGIRRFYRGIVRNVEDTDDPTLPEAQARITAVKARDAQGLLDDLEADENRRCRLLHLSEGITALTEPDSSARRHFLALEVAPDRWAISNALAGIHSAGLLPEDFEILGQHGGSMVWSPLSNLLLYGDTARVDAADAAGVRIGLGSDWSPSGSKNLLGELKVAWLYNQHVLNGRFTARDMVAMVTRGAATILKWDAALGSLEAGKRADVMVIDGVRGDPFEALIRATESSVRLVMINGVARCGLPNLMKSLVPRHQSRHVEGRKRRLYLRQETTHEAVKSVSLREAEAELKRALKGIKKLARELEKPKPRELQFGPVDQQEPVVWSLALDEIDESSVEFGPRLPFAGPRDFTGFRRAPRRLTAAAAKIPLSEILEPIKLDPLTTVDDSDFLEEIAAQPNVPEPVRRDLRDMY